MTQRQVENQVSKRMLAGEFGEGDTVHIDHTPEGCTFTKTVAATAVAEREQPSRESFGAGIQR